MEMILKLYERWQKDLAEMESARLNAEQMEMELKQELAHNFADALKIDMPYLEHLIESNKKV